MLGFSPIASSTLGGSGAVREVVPAGLTGVSAAVNIGALTLSTNATISDEAIRKPETVHLYDPDGDGVGVVRNNEYPYYSWANAFILGDRDQIPLGQDNSDNSRAGPVWDEAVAGDSALSVQTKTTAELTSDPVVSQSSWVPLVNGDYTYPATYDSSLGYDAVAKPVTVNLSHLPSETIINNAATVGTISDPLLATLTFPVSDPTLFNVVVGQVQTINTYNPSDTDTYFNSLITGQVGEIQWPNENKHYLLQKYDTDKGFLSGTVQLESIGTDKTIYGLGAAWVSYGFRLQPQITTANFPDGTPVSQEHTLLVTLALGTIQTNVSKELPSVEGTLSSNLSVNTSLTSFVAGFDIGTVGLPDPQWYLSTSRVEIIAEPNQPANDVIYPYASRSPTTGPTQTDFDFTVSLGALSSPIAVDQPVDGLGPTVGIGNITVRSFNTVPLTSSLMTLTENLSVLANVTEIISSSPALVTSSLGGLTVVTTSNAVCTSLVSPVGLGQVVFAANANTAPSGFEGIVRDNLNWSIVNTSNQAVTGHSVVVSMTTVGYAAYKQIASLDPLTLTLGKVGVASRKSVSGFVLDVANSTPTGLGVHFDFEAIKHLYSRDRSEHVTSKGSRIVNPKFTSSRHIKPKKDKNNLAA